MLREDLINSDSEIIAKSFINWGKLEGKTILVSGATGYVSQYIIHAVLKRNDLFHTGIKVIAACRSKMKADQRFISYYGRSDFELIVHNIFEKIEIEQEIDYVIHTASPAGLVNSNKDPVETFKVNVLGCDNLLLLAEKKKAEFLLFSSVDVYGKGDGKRFEEKKLGVLDTMDSRNVYAYAKRASENLGSCYLSKGVVFKSVRPTQIMGGGIALDDGRIHIDFIAQILKNKKIIIKGDGSPIRSFIYITDAITGILTVLTNGSNGEAYNICNEKAELSVLELARMMTECARDDIEIEFNMETRRNNPEVNHAISVVTASSNKIEALGWRPRVQINEACKKMMNFYGIETND